MADTILRRIPTRHLRSAFDEATRRYLAAHGWMAALRAELARREKLSQEAH